MISWPLRSPCARNTSECKLCSSTEIKYLFFIRFISSCKAALCDLDLGALQECWHKTLIRCFSSTLTSTHFLYEPMECYCIPSNIIIHDSLSDQSLSRTPMSVWRIGFESSANNFCSSKMIFFSSESFYRKKIFTR